jgi:ATP synthase subunit 6
MLSNFLYSPLEQFEVYSVAFSFFNNAHVSVLITVCAMSLVWLNAVSKSNFLPTNAWSSLKNIIQEELMVLTGRNIGHVGQQYYPFLLVMFLSIMGFNLVGMIPYSFTITSHIVMTLVFSFTFFIGTNLRAIIDMKLCYFSLFLPSGAPVPIMPFLVVIELISYFARLASLAIRLFANMMAGHSLMKILIGFVYGIFLFDTIGIVLGWIPFLLVFVITFLETAVALIQAYVFTILMCIYIKDLYVAH